MKNAIFRAVIGMGIAFASMMGISGTAAYAQALSQAELNEFAELAFKSERSNAEEQRLVSLKARLKQNPPIEALEQEEEATFASTQQLKLPYLEIAPDFGITHLSGSIRYKDSFAGYVDESDSVSIDGTAARVGVDVRLNVPINDNLEVFVGGWSFANFGGNTALHNEEEDELVINDHYGILGYSVNNYFTAYTGVSVPIGEHFCDCFGPTQISLNGYVGARVGTIKLDLEYNNFYGTDDTSETKTYLSPLIGGEIKLRSGRLFGSGFNLGAAVGYQYQHGTDASIKGTVNNVSGKFNFDIESQQHIYGSLRLVRPF